MWRRRNDNSRYSTFSSGQVSHVLPNTAPRKKNINTPRARCRWWGRESRARWGHKSHLGNQKEARHELNKLLPQCEYYGENSTRLSSKDELQPAAQAEKATSTPGIQQRFTCSLPPLPGQAPHLLWLMDGEAAAQPQILLSPL